MRQPNDTMSKCMNVWPTLYQIITIICTQENPNRYCTNAHLHEQYTDIVTTVIVMMNFAFVINGSNEISSGIGSGKFCTRF